MVKQSPVLVIALAIPLAACSVQYYDDYDSRFAYHDVFNFLTPADRAPALNDSYEFIVISDIHINADAEGFAKVKDHIGAAKFIVITGDITGDGTREQIQRFIDTARTFSIPCYPVMGNHDMYDNRAAPWKELIGSASYRIDSTGGDTTLFILDNANGCFGYDQLEWFEQELKSAQRHSFVFAHQNFFTTSFKDFEQATDLRERALVMSLLQGRSEAMFMGHLHKRIVKAYGGVTYIMTEAFSEEKTLCRVAVSNSGISYQFERLP
ncbi:MAG: metallophosphoesterase [Treponema sp.]|jgi:3',5'-cyclic AMP phosphodiesterase CpdA|nr:metallophosphoesterase [Treponema sp.]